MLQLIEESLLFILPTALSGLVFIFILKKGWLSDLKKPIHQKIFGENKTWLGPVIMTSGTLLFTLLLNHFSKFYTISLGNITNILIIGLAYSLGELPNSFLKRRIGISAGGQAKNKILKMTFSIIDISDSVLAVALSIFLLKKTSLPILVTMIALGLLIHLTTDFYMRLKKLK